MGRDLLRRPSDWRKRRLLGVGDVADLSPGSNATSHSGTTTDLLWSRIRCPMVILLAQHVVYNAQKACRGGSGGMRRYKTMNPDAIVVEVPNNRMSARLRIHHVQIIATCGSGEIWPSINSNRLGKDPPSLGSGTESKIIWIALGIMVCGRLPLGTIRYILLHWITPKRAPNTNPTIF